MKKPQDMEYLLYGWAIAIVVIVVSALYLFGVFTQTENEEYCEAWCISKQLEYDDFKLNICGCKKCETKELLDKNVSSCLIIEFNLEIE